MCVCVGGGGGGARSPFPYTKWEGGLEGLSNVEVFLYGCLNAFPLTVPVIL